MISDLKARCHTLFQRALTAFCCVFKEITLIGSNQRKYFENAHASSKRTLKTRVATRLKGLKTSTYHEGLGIGASGPLLISRGKGIVN